MKIRGFITHKRAESYLDCADYFAIDLKDRKIAVSDGISQSFSPSEWSRILVQSYINNKWEPGQDLKPLQSQWLEEVRANLTKLQKQGAVTYMMENMIDERESAGATFCGLSFKKESYDWVCNVIGDSALVKLSRESIDIFSSQNGTFNNRPDYFDSYASQSVGELKSFQGQLQKGEVLFVVSDPLSELFQKSLENKTEKQIIEKILSVRNQNDFCGMVESLRTDFGMHNDDTTLVIVEYDGKKDFNIEQIVMLDELIEKEQQKTELPESRCEIHINEADRNELMSESQLEYRALIYDLENIREKAQSVFFRCVKPYLNNRNLVNKLKKRKQRNYLENLFACFWNELIKELKS